MHRNSEADRTGAYYSSDEVLGELRAMLEAKRARREKP